MLTDEHVAALRSFRALFDEQGFCRRCSSGTIINDLHGLVPCADCKGIGHFRSDAARTVAGSFTELDVIDRLLFAESALADMAEEGRDLRERERLKAKNVLLRAALGAIRHQVVGSLWGREVIGIVTDALREADDLGRR